MIFLVFFIFAQEDAHSIFLEMEDASKTGFFGVFDGHGGKEVARFVALYLVSFAMMWEPQISCTYSEALRIVVED